MLLAQGPFQSNLNGLCFYGGAKFVRTIVYVDGFNLYHRQLERQPTLRWLNIKALAEQILSPSNIIVEVKYYTARVSGAINPQTPARQQVYLDALATVPEISIFFGRFLASKKWAGLVTPPEFRPVTQIPQPWPNVVKVHKTEEKGSDVNLASHLIRDGFTNAYDVAAVISNDSDLVEPLRIITQELKKPVGLITPVSNPNPELVKAASFIKHIHKADLAASQFPDTIPRNPEPPLRKPATWV